MSKEPDFIPVAEWARRTGLSRGTLYNMIARGEIPHPVRLSANRIAWPVAEYREWLAELQRTDFTDFQHSKEEGGEV